MIPDEKIQEVKDKADILEVVGERVQLKRTGSNYQGCCPFHNEKTGSFNVNTNRQAYHCFGCGEGGNAITFIMKMDGLSFPEAVKSLAQKYGVEIEERQLTPQERKFKEERERMADAMNAAMALYHQGLKVSPSAAAAREYLEKKGFSSEIIEAFKLGYAPSEWDVLKKHLNGKSYSNDLLKKLGLLKTGKDGKSIYDTLRNRVVVPIMSKDGKNCLSLMGIAIDQETKPSFIELTDSTIFKKETHLFGYSQAVDAIRTTGKVIVVRRHLDMLALRVAGIENVISPCGGNITERHVKLLSNLYGGGNGYEGAKTLDIVRLSSPDSKILKSAFDDIPAFGKGNVNYRIGLLPENTSPSYLIKKQGMEKFEEVVAAAVPALELYFTSVRDVCGQTVEGRHKGAVHVAAKIASVDNTLAQALYVKRACEVFQVEPEFINSQIAETQQPSS